MNKRVNREISYMELFYGDKAEEWKNEKDDRKLFSNLYFSIIEAYKSIENCPAYVKVAVNKQRTKDEKTLNSILERFKR